MLLRKYEPFSLIDKFFDDETFVSFQPRADVMENEKEYQLVVELPGLDKKDVKVEVKDNRLTLSGEKKRANVTKEEGYNRYETHVGSFTRTWNLGRGVDVNQIKAEAKYGVFTIHLPKTEAELKKDEVKLIDIQ